MSEQASQAPHPTTVEACWQLIDELWPLKELVEQLAQRVAHLEEQLNLNSANSSKPPPQIGPTKRQTLLKAATSPVVGREGTKVISENWCRRRTSKQRFPVFRSVLWEQNSSSDRIRPGIRS